MTDHTQAETEAGIDVISLGRRYHVQTEDGEVLAIDVRDADRALAELRSSTSAEVERLRGENDDWRETLIAWLEFRNIRPTGPAPDDITDQLTWYEGALAKQGTAEDAETIASLRARVETLEADLRKERHERINTEYMLGIATQMLGDNGVTVMRRFKEMGVKRFHADWGPKAGGMTGEQRAEYLLKVLNPSTWTEVSAEEIDAEDAQIDVKPPLPTTLKPSWTRSAQPSETAMQKLDLLPCPFCGSDARHIAADGWHGVRCTGCDATISLCLTKDAAIAAWTARALPPPSVLVSREDAETPTPAVRDIAAERRRQVQVEGWTSEHDDTHRCGELALGAAAYATHASFSQQPVAALAHMALKLWPWRTHWWKPKTPREDLVRAGALIAAEIERLDRLSQHGGEG